MGEPIQVGSVIVQSIKRMGTSSDATIGHPFVISHLCSLAGVPEEDDDEIIGPDIPLYYLCTFCFMYFLFSVL
jgi:hypothetical protein